MNFCFWPDNSSGQFEYEHMTRNIEKILDSEPSFFTPLRLATVTEGEIRRRVFNNNWKFALVDERARLLREIGQRLLDADKTFLSFVQANTSCPKLVKSIVDTFEGFRDQAIYKGRQVFFYKRAQILVADLARAYDDFAAAFEELVEDLPQLTD